MLWIYSKYGKPVEANEKKLIRDLNERFQEEQMRAADVNQKEKKRQKANEDMADRQLLEILRNMKSKDMIDTM